MLTLVRIVLADDHAVLRVGLKTFLQEQTNPTLRVVGEASTGVEALELVERLRPDLLILDLSMPELGGLETTIELRKRNLPVKILILTQFGEAVYLRRLMEVGADGYLLKSARGEELLGVIRALASGGKYIDPSLARDLISKALGTEAEPSSMEEAYGRLTPRERQVFKLVAEGLSNKEIATNLEIAVKTVMAHRVSMMDKLGIHNRSKLVQLAIQLGVITVSKRPE